MLGGDETALPVINRWIEELYAGTRVTSPVAVSSEAEE
ncbi:SIP domain-containing protein [Paracoccus sp. SY]